MAVFVFLFVQFKPLDGPRNVLIISALSSLNLIIMTKRLLQGCLDKDTSQ